MSEWIRRLLEAQAPTSGRDNPIAAAMRATAASADQQLELRLQNPRPVYLLGPLKEKAAFPPDFLLSPAAAWNEENPMVVRNIGAGRGVVIPPRFRATPFGDPKKGTRDEVRRGPFSVAVALESAMPVDWYDADYASYRKAASVSAAFGRLRLWFPCRYRRPIEPSDRRRAVTSA